MSCNTIKKIFFLFILCLVHQAVDAQVLNPKKIKDEADVYYEQELYSKAENLYQRYLNSKVGGDLDALLKLSVCYYKQNDLKSAKRFLGQIKDLKKSDPLSHYYLGRIAHQEYQFAESVEHYKEFLRNVNSNHPFRKRTIDAIKRAANGIKFKNLSQTAYVENLGDKLNSKYDEYGPVPSPNFTSKFYFSSARPQSIGGLRNIKGLKDSKFGQYNEDMYSVVLSNGEWSTIESINPSSNTSKKDVLMDFSDDGSVMMYLKYFDKNASDLYADTFSNDIESKIVRPYRSDFNAEKGDCYLFTFKDSVMLFSSRRPGGYGGYDLYYSILRDGRWTRGINLGKQINSSYDEVSPFLTKDGRTLFFSSNGLKSLGGFDIFKSTFSETQALWSQAENVGLPINSPGDDRHLRISKDGMSAFLSSSRKEGFGGEDLYIAYFKKEVFAQRNNGKPVHFALVKPKIEDDLVGNSTGSTSTSNPNEVKEYFLAPIYFDDSDMVLSPQNKKLLENWAKVLQIYPAMKAEIQSHSIESGPNLFDLYFSIKRGEQVMEFLKSQGVKPNQLVAKGYGANFPLVKSKVNGKKVNLANKLNRRIDLKIQNPEAHSIKINYDFPPITDDLKDRSFSRYESRTRGLSYKIQITATRQLYNNKLLDKYGDIILEMDSKSNNYLYTVGLYSNFSLAEKKRQELFVKGIYEAFIVPYIDGKRISRAVALENAQKYPDLKRYYEGTK